MKRCVEELEFLEEQLSGTTSDVVFCHNDLLSANILYQAASAPEAKPAKVRFIDYEYGNYNWRAYVDHPMHSLAQSPCVMANAYLIPPHFCSATTSRTIFVR